MDTENYIFFTRNKKYTYIAIFYILLKVSSFTEKINSTIDSNHTMQ